MLSITISLWDLGIPFPLTMLKFLVVVNFKPVLSSQLTSVVTSKDFSLCKCLSKAEAVLSSTLVPQQKV